MAKTCQSPACRLTKDEKERLLDEAADKYINGKLDLDEYNDAILAYATDPSSIFMVKAILRKEKALGYGRYARV